MGKVLSRTATHQKGSLRRAFFVCHILAHSRKVCGFFAQVGNKKRPVGLSAGHHLKKPLRRLFAFRCRKRRN